MANLRTAMDSAFWDLNISTPRAIDGVSRAVPGDPIPVDGARASRALRIQQLSLLGNGFPLGIIPSFPPSANRKELGSFALQSLLGKAVFENWWVGLIGQFRPLKLISSIKSEVSAADEWELPLLKDTAKHFLDKSLYAVGLCSQIALAPSSSLLLSTENHGEKNKRRTRAMLFHKLPDHDISLEAAWPELFIDHKGQYWNVPESISLDCASLVYESGLQYRFGIHENSGIPQAVDSNSREAPLSLLPGVCAKAAFSFEKSKDLWRPKETEEDATETRTSQFRIPSYDIRLQDPRSTISGVFGGTCEAWFGGWKRSVGIVDSHQDVETTYARAENRGRLFADMFGSACYTFQHGEFRKIFGDLTRIDARVDVCSVLGLGKKMSSLFRNAQSNQSPDSRSSPRLSLIFQQQVAGPIVFRIDSKFSLDSLTGKQGPQMEDLMCSLSYSLRLMRSGKVVAWYSTKRKEGMIELRLFEF